MSEPFDTSVAEIRRFNRYYTGVIGLLDEHFLKSPFTLSEGRVLYELAHRDGLTASDLVQSLRLDPGYLSRILARFEKKKLLKRTPREEDRRQAALNLTAAGKGAFRQINKTSQDEIGAMVAGLDEGQLRRLTQSLAQVRRILARSRDDGPPLFVLRDHRVGDMGWIIHRQARLYAEEYGWNDEFEALVAEITAKFIRNFDPQRERCWVAELDGEIVGAVFLVKESDEVARLRMLHVDVKARGQGLGRRLVEECIRFARARGYKTLTLWTNDILVSARRIYEAAGFKLVKEEKHRSFGKDLVGQHWSLAL
ncbi:MAG TPA: bifunctional helix-turn-helix transcriptional regulator/GNAT family N-acetyltransferase [Verrucomicrobiae bacterium]|nr:bifunctional helix-turn-helix transcriptional regulator/GNAT family N-acetyltransferase [Verrucomicrobiae bacterium]